MRRTKREQRAPGSANDRANSPSKRNSSDRDRQERLGEALVDILPSSDPPPETRQEVSHEPPAASLPVGGSEVLDVSGAEGRQSRQMHDVIHGPDEERIERHLAANE